MTYDEYLFPYVFRPPCIHCRNSQENDEENNEIGLDTKDLKLENKIVNKTFVLNEQIIHPSLLNLSYPFITEHENSEIQSIINHNIIEEVTLLFKKYVFIPEKTDFKEISGFYKVPLNEKGMLSLLFGLYVYTGGAHGTTIYSSITLGSENGNKYKFTDLFNPKLNYIDVLNEIIVSEIEEKGITLLRKFEGISKEQQYYLTQDSLVLYFQLYDYTPYADGLFEITIPYSDISNLLYPLSPIQKLV